MGASAGAGPDDGIALRVEARHSGRQCGVAVEVSGIRGGIHVDDMWIPGGRKVERRWEGHFQGAHSAFSRSGYQPRARGRSLP